MNTGERIKKLRKALDLTQQKFGERIGIKGNTVAQYELGRSNPIDAVLSLICREFKANEEWLRTGKGEMFKAAPSTALDDMAQEYNYTHRDYIIVEKFSNLNRKDRDVILNYIKEVAAGFAGVDPDTPAIPNDDLNKVAIVLNDNEPSGNSNSYEIESSEEISPEYKDMSVSEMLAEANKWETLAEKKRMSLASQKQNENLKENTQNPKIDDKIS